MNPLPIEQLCLQRASEPGGLNVTSTKPDQTSPALVPELRMAIPLASQDHSAAVDPVPAAAGFSPRVHAALSSTRISFPSASQGNVAVVGPISTAATSRRIPGRFTEIARHEGRGVNAIERYLAETFIQSFLWDPRNSGLKGRRDLRVHPSSSRASAVLTLFSPASSEAPWLSSALSRRQPSFGGLQRANDDNGVNP